MIKNFESFLNESSWIPNFKSQGEFIGRKDAVSPEELEKIGYYLRDFYEIEDVTVGQIRRTPDYGSYSAGDTIEAYGVRAHTLVGREETTFTYYWRERENSDFPDLENGWVGRLDSKIGGSGKHPRQFMSPLQFLECVGNFFIAWQALGWLTGYTTQSKLDTVRKEMEKLALQSPRRGRISGKKYGL